MHHYESATQRSGALAIDSLEIDGRVSGSGLHGTFHTWRDGANERRDTTLGPRRERWLYADGRTTIQDYNGDVRELRGVVARRETTQRFIDSGDFVQHPESARLLGKTTLRGHDAYALEITATGGEPETLTLDAVSGLPLREEYIEGDGPVWVDIDEWREIDGHLFPWRTTVSDGEHLFDVVQTTERVRINGGVSADVFTPFVPRALDLPAPITVPLTVTSSHYFCEVGIGTKTYRFLIDSGSSGLVIDSRIAREQGLPEEGSLEVRGATRAGGLHLVRIPSLRIGSATMRDLIGSSLDLGGATRGTLRTDGILGYPLFAAGLVRLDPVARTMTLAAANGFVPRGAKLELELDRALPEARLGINGTLRAPFLLDTGNGSDVLLFGWFVKAHPGIVPFSSEARNSYGIGGSTAAYRTVLDELELAGTRLYQRDAAVVLSTQGAFADRYDAGNVGLGVLRNFVITFDEPHYAVYLEPAATFDDGRNRPLRTGNIGVAPLLPR